MAAVRKLVDAAAKAQVTMQAPGRPPFETEEIDAGAATLRFHPAQKLPRAVAALRDRLLEIGAEVLESPESGVELTLDAANGKAGIAAIGSGAAVDWESAAATFDLFAANEALLSSGTFGLGLTGSQRLSRGWRHEASLPHMEFEPAMTLQVRIVFRLKYPDGAWREAQLTAVAGKGWG
jgi:hypothetical protein